MSYDGLMETRFRCVDEQTIGIKMSQLEIALGGCRNLFSVYSQS